MNNSVARSFYEAAFVPTELHASYYLDEYVNQAVDQEAYDTVGLVSVPDFDSLEFTVPGFVMPEFIIFGGPYE